MSLQLEKRPFLIGLAGLAIGLSAIQSPWNLLALIPLLFLCRSLKSWTIAAFFLFLGIVLHPADLPLLKSDFYSPSSLKVLSQPYRTSRDLRFDGLIGVYRARVIAPLSRPIHYGDVLAGGVEIKPPPADQESAYRSAGLQGVVRLNAPVRLSEGPRIFASLDAFLDRFNRFLSENVSAADAQWIDALWFRTGPLPEEDQKDLATAGAYTFVAASGLQVYLIFGMILWVTGGLFSFERRWQLGLGALVLIAYWAVTGMHGNTFRACFTCAAFSAAYLVQREPDLLSITALAGLSYLMFFPRVVFSLGFQLSMAIPLALGWFLPAGPWFRERKWRRCLEALKATFIVFLAGQPLVAIHTGRIGFGGIVSSLILGFITPVILVASLVAFGLGLFFAPLAKGILVILVVPLTSFIRTVVETVAGFSPVIAIPPIGAGWLWFYYSSWMITWRAKELKPEDSVDLDRVRPPLPVEGDLQSRLREDESRSW
jgi:ComEC/Rec2-related protein